MKTHLCGVLACAPERMILTGADGGVAVKWINELEWVDGQLLANVWMRDCIARINPNTGAVTAWVHLQVSLPGVGFLGCLGAAR